MKVLPFLSLTALLLATTMVEAQSDNSATTTSGIRFGVKGGVNFATVTGKDFDTPDSRTSFHAGVLTEFPLTEMISLQAEALYSGQGFKSDITGTDGSKVEYQLDYINVPVLVKVFLTTGLSLEVGPQFSFKVNEEIDTDPSDNPGDIDLNAAKDYDFGIAGGVTFRTQGGFFATGRYTYGLTDIIEDADVKNSVFQLGVGFLF
ncbi:MULTISPECIES: porin family protein [unclassified Flavobacterium]|uniref:porin family protein n=1 Tax=unclassified Flavobacterium TaxID=196869 RepID=UPI001F143A9F|nr:MULTISPECIES: porin family protein [unclassified Flavobacterium]UMY67088.1 PorT family protein [Flavobacterium sp. HJ-32-4]